MNTNSHEFTASLGQPAEPLSVGRNFLEKRHPSPLFLGKGGPGRGGFSVKPEPALSKFWTYASRFGRTDTARDGGPLSVVPRPFRDFVHHRLARIRTGVQLAEDLLQFFDELPFEAGLNGAVRQGGGVRHN